MNEGGCKCGMRTETWKLTSGRWVVYTEDLEKAKEAIKHRDLRWMGTYYHKGGGPFARQFVGPKEAVLALAQQKRTRPLVDKNTAEEERHTDQTDKPQKHCEVCGRPFIPDNGKGKAKYCSDVCRQTARRRQDRIRKQKLRLAEA